MTSIFSNTRFAFLAKSANSSTGSLSDDEVVMVSKPAQTPRIVPRRNPAAFKTIWVGSAILAILMPVIIRLYRMNTDEWFQQAGVGAEETSRTLHFVYAWQIVMFLAIVAYGYGVIKAQKSPAMLIGALLVWFQYNLLAMLLLGNFIEGRGGMELERFYGQFPVLMFMTNAWYVVHGLVFSFILAIQDSVAKQQQKAAAEAASNSHSKDDAAVNYETAGDYKRMDAPPSPTGSVGDDDYVKVI